MNGRTVTNRDLYRAIDDLKELVGAKLELVEQRVSALEVARRDRFSFRLAFWPVVVAALVSGAVGAAVAVLAQ